jgi:hypothetical protein
MPFQVALHCDVRLYARMERRWLKDWRGVVNALRR